MLTGTTKIERENIGWLAKRVRGFDRIRRSLFLENVTNMGGFIAGGFARKMLRDGSTDGLRDAVIGRSDVDIFCRTQQAFELIESTPVLGEYPIQKGVSGPNAAIPGPAHHSKWMVTRGKNALWRWEFEEKIIGRLDRLLLDWSNWTQGSYPPFRVQLVKCHFGTPEEILDGFDLVNCMIGFDRDNVWFHPEIERLERERTLTMNRTTRYLGPRILKYFKLHGYDRLCPKARAALSQWLKERFAENDWGEFFIGQNIVPELIKFGQTIMSDDMLVELVGLSSIRACIFKVSYDVLDDGTVRGSNGTSLRQVYGTVDPMDIELRRRITMKGSRVQPGDMVEMVPIELGNQVWRSCIILSGSEKPRRPFENINDVFWNVMLPDYTTGIIPESYIMRVLMPFSACHDVTV